MEWYTPEEYISAVREVLGEIELDPASSRVANETVQALRFFDRETNGVEQEWKARTVYLNPPHDKRYTIRPWISKLIASYQAGHIEEAILLVDAVTEASWFQPLYAYPLCFVQGRIRFINGGGEIAGQPINGSVFVYLGKQPGKCITVFQRFGKVLFSPPEDAL